MFAGRLTDRIYSIAFQFWSRFPGLPFCWGTLIGLLAVSLSLSWTLTWSDDRALASAAVVMFACGVVGGTRVSLSRFFSLSELAVMACTWTLLQPWLNPLLESLLWYLPSSVLSTELLRFGMGLILAAPTWLLAGWLCASVVSDVSAQSHSESSLAAISAGVVLGLFATTFVMAPWIGAWTCVAVAAVLAIAARFLPASNATEAASISQEPATNMVNVDETATIKSSGNMMFVIGQSVAALALGGLIAVILRLMSQLMPDTVQVTFAEWGGLVAGIGLGQWVRNNRSRLQVRSASLWIIAACSSALLLAAMPVIVGMTLNATTTLTSVFLQMTFRSILLILATAPLGFGLSGLIPVSMTTSENHQKNIARWWPLPLLVAAGFVATQLGFESIGFVSLLTLCTLVLVATGIVTLFATRHDGLSRWGMIGVSCCSAFGLSVPLWQANHNPVITAKLLFSTPSFVAHRAGWESRLLPMLDDARAIDVREGVRGPLTVWRSHGLELHLRESGIPKSVVTANPETHPQFAPEVLQAVFPLVLSQNPNRVLILGASNGVPLATCLKFPVQDVTCMENDGPLVQVIRGPIARETGHDPFQDERVQLVTIPPTIAVMSMTETFDVILSSPPASSIVAGGAMFTANHYRNIARVMAPEGIFCQRFPCVDYGIDPMRIVVQSMRQAFTEVIAIESSAGEFLLLGTNTAGTFVAGDLPTRLQGNHVRKVLASSGLDWSALLNYPAYDDAALGEICASGRAWTNAPSNGILALQAPVELMRWGAKLNELHQVLDARRTSQAPYLNKELEAKVAQEGVHLSRKSRLLEWMDDRYVSPDLLRRLAELVTQQKVVRENPDGEFYSWGYRTALREQLQSKRASGVQKASHSMTAESVHPEDQRRQDYFVALGQAASNPTTERIAAVTAFLKPFDPMVSYFAHLEIADLYAKGKSDPAAELTHRLHSVYFSPVADGSTRNIVTTLELIIQHPEVIPDAAQRFDILNGLLQTLRTHWETRQSFAVKSPRRRLAEIERSLVAIDKTVEVMSGICREAGISTDEMNQRKLVIDRLLTRPLHAYRGQLQQLAAKNESRTRAIMDGENPQPQK